MNVLADYGRLLRAGTALVRYDVILPGEYLSRLPLPARLAGRIMRIIGGRAKGRQGERMAKALEKLGPAYIKLGQFLATRPDVFGSEVATDLSRLKDKIPPFSNEEARKALIQEFGEADAERLFPSLGDPVAAASLAQVHKMETASGTKAVKILRPGVERMISQELRAIRRAARTVERTSVESRRLEPVAFTETVAVAMEKELDLRLEAGGADQMRALALEDDWFDVPAVDWDRTGQRVLTTEWVDGISLTDPRSLEQAGISRPELANAITRGFLSHAIGHGVFHADMHEGNILISPNNRVSLVDFGLIGRIGLNERRFLAQILWGFIQRDYQRVAEVHFEAGYVPAHQSVGEFAQALRSIGEPIHGKPAEEVYMGRILLQLMDYTRTFGMRLRPELVLLQKTMVQVEGVARSIDPGHDIWKAAEPVVKGWIAKNLGPAGAAKLAADGVRDVADRLKRLPDVMDEFERFLRDARVQQTAASQGPKFPWFQWLAGTILVSALTGVLVAQLA
ncbi:2-polyprenylphenol 6-hydroxylase [Henriciella litoralis]|uniref:2-polyprenylphenol 6-hydroxylase n=1 Tax=Henriciella litoralis TaxID=568102 RepID=UPI001F1A008B|nr:2-polyprenylphenol 6-hydroxylase [Henriciella litoralis]